MNATTTMNNNNNNNNNTIYQSEGQHQFNLKFQRDINRLTDTSDRSSRKRGLQNLVDTLPWESKRDIEQFFLPNLPMIVPLLSDPVEKCRELSIKIFIKIFNNNVVLTSNQLQEIIQVICQRVNEIPFPEPTEEIRFQVIELIRLFISDSYFHVINNNTLDKSLTTLILATLAKALHDSYPNSKRSAAEAVIEFTAKFPDFVRMNPKPVMTSLCANGLHQHSKTRVVSLKVLLLITSTSHLITINYSRILYRVMYYLQAIGVCLACVSEADYLALMQEGVLILLGHSIADATVGVRLGLAQLCEHVLSKRFTRVFAVIESDMQLLSMLLILCRDDAVEVRQVATQVSSVTLLHYIFYISYYQMV